MTTLINLHNTLSKSVQPFVPLDPNLVTIYSCGPTVYDHAHIGNLSAFIVADVLRRMISANGLDVKHVMNFTDVDDKTIRRSQADYPNLVAHDALAKLTTHYSDVFVQDMQLVGNDVQALTFVRATDPETIDGMQQLITQLHTAGVAYIADDGVYFSIEAYRKLGRKYGQLVEVSTDSTSSQRIQNDEYDKDSAHDFALWKTHRPGEPSWPFTVDGHKLDGRPGWHIECSVMSSHGLGQPFDIHTGGIDLAFPHHENEIAQSTATTDSPVMAQFFVHNEHVLVEGKKMSKSAQNFYTLKDLVKAGVDPLAFRLLVLQSHYRKPTNFSMDGAAAAHSRLQHWRAIAALRHQTHTIHGSPDFPSLTAIAVLRTSLSDDLDTPDVLRQIDEIFTEIEAKPLTEINHSNLTEIIEQIDAMLGLGLAASTPDIDEESKLLLVQRARVREAKNWSQSDKIRDQLAAQGITVRDTPAGQVWEYNQ